MQTPAPRQCGGMLPRNLRRLRLGSGGRLRPLRHLPLRRHLGHALRHAAAVRRLLRMVFGSAARRSRPYLQQRDRHGRRHFRAVHLLPVEPLQSAGLLLAARGHAEAVQLALPAENPGWRSRLPAVPARSLPCPQRPKRLGGPGADRRGAAMETPAAHGVRDRLRAIRLRAGLCEQHHVARRGYHGAACRAGVPPLGARPRMRAAVSLMRGGRAVQLVRRLHGMPACGRRFPVRDRP